jgi:hypothetical protein
MWLLTPLLTLLPERWRRALVGDAPVHWVRAAVFSGLLEALGSLGGLIAWYFIYMYRAVGAQIGPTLEATKGVPGEGAAFAMGIGALASLVFHPLTWVLVYFSFEGTLRTLAALLNEEVAPTLPLALVDWAISAGQRRSFERRVPLIVDAVTVGAENDPWDLKVESCREKPTWKHPLTIRFRDSYFQVLGQAPLPGAPQRPYVYLLRLPPRGEAYRGLEEYDPAAVTLSEPPRPHFLVAAFQDVLERWRIRRLPRVADIVFHADGREGWHLKVESCRPKPAWSLPRTIRFDGRLYRVEHSFPAKPPRPFGYLLRMLPENEAARGVLDYTPDEPLYEED